MIGTFVTIWLAYANIFIATFILVYAYLFLHKTQEHRDRRPWDFLFLASFFYLLFQVFIVLVLSGFTFSGVNLDLISNAMAFLYSGCVLLAFVSQHDLILRSQLILISKKDDAHAEAEEDVELKIGLPDGKPKKGKK
jgi:hypothetical protein